MRYFYLILLLTLIVGCGPSAEEKAHMEKMKQDSIELYDRTQVLKQIQAKEAAKQQEIAKASRPIYRASDFGLIPGVIVRQSPADNDALTPSYNGIIAFHIRIPDGTIKVIDIPERTWKLLYIGDSLQ